MNPEQYNTFIRGGLSVGFTDDQIDFLAYWLEIVFNGLKEKKAPSEINPTT